MLRQFTTIDGKGKKKKVAFDPTEITLIEEVGPKLCNVIIKINNNDIIYSVLGSFKDIFNIASLSEFGFMEN